MFDRTSQMAILLVFATTAGAGAAQIENKDAEAHKVVVTAAGVREEVEIAPSASVSTCPSGCFLTAPGGVVLPLSGEETVVIEAGKTRIAK